MSEEDEAVAKAARIAKERADAAQAERDRQREANKKKGK